MDYKKLILARNNHQNVMKPEYDVNGYYARLRFTSDDFLKKIRWPDRNVMKFHEIFMRPSKSFQKVIRSEPETL